MEALNVIIAPVAATFTRSVNYTKLLDESVTPFLFVVIITE